MSTDSELVTAATLHTWPLPSPGGSKYERGQVLIVGGARFTPGAALLAGHASLRVGAGRLTLAVARSVAADIAVAFPESGVVALEETVDEHVSGQSLADQHEYERADVVLIGPGLDDLDEATALVSRLVPRLDSEAIVILDAFAFGALEQPDVLDQLRGRLVLTPNREEAELLLGHPLSDQNDGILEIAQRYDAVVTCFGTIAAPDGRRWIVDGSTVGLGTSGSGDVLAGAIAGIAARGCSVEQAAVWGTYLHVRAGHLAGDPAGSVGYLAHELTEALPRALAETSRTQ